VHCLVERRCTRSRKGVHRFHNLSKVLTHDEEGILSGGVMKVLAVLIVGGIILLILGFCQYNRCERAFGTLTQGTPKDIVVSAFGKPVEIRSCGPVQSWEGTILDSRVVECTEEYWYFSRISPEQWAVGFDREGRTVSKYHYISL
jgi:hypothetical protein